jgi:hypothetical protein
MEGKVYKTFLSKTGGLMTQNLAKPYNAYAKIKPISKYDKPDKHELRRIAGAILSEVGEQLVKSKGGVFIKNFGYFFVWKTALKTTYGREYKHNTERIEYFNHHTDQYLYKPTFIPAAGKSHLRFWSMDNKFSSVVRDGINKQLRAGHKYVNYMFTLRKLLNLPT